MKPVKVVVLSHPGENILKNVQKFFLLERPHLLYFLDQIIELVLKLPNVTNVCLFLISAARIAQVHEILCEVSYSSGFLLNVKYCTIFC